MKNVQTLKMNTSHIWGRYYELRISPTCIQRTIFLEEEGKNSIHRHQTEEWMTVIEGEVEFTLGHDPSMLEKIILKQGEAIHIPSLVWHRIRYISGEHIIEGVKCAVINETMLGEHYNGDYLIERLENASPSIRHRK